MIRDRWGDTNRRWLLEVSDFWLTPGTEQLGEEVQARSGSRYTSPTSCYDTNPWDGTAAVEDIRHFRHWENPAPWDKVGLGLV